MQEVLEKILEDMYELAQEMACDGDERCNDIEDIRLQLVEIAQRKA